MDGPYRRYFSVLRAIWLSRELKLYSLSVGCMFVGTLLQPKMKKRKSVATLNEKDTKDANKYVLTHQDLDSDGGIATKLVKVVFCHTCCLLFKNFTLLKLC